MSREASGRLTGVEAVQSEPVQWLNTTVELAACQLIRKQRSSPRTSGNTRVRVLISSTEVSMTLLGPHRY
jgi:hypothetical protein